MIMNRDGRKISPEGYQRRRAAPAARRNVFPLSEPEAAALVNNTLNLRDRCALELMLFCGLRRAEVCFLEIARVDFAAGEIDVIGKGAKPRRVPMLPFVAAHLKDLIGRRQTGFVFEAGNRRREGGSLSLRGLAVIVDIAARRAGVKQKTPGFARVNPHQLRHTFARRMKDAGMPWEDLALILGHGDPGMTARVYGNHSYDQVKEKFLAIHNGG